MSPDTHGSLAVLTEIHDAALAPGLLGSPATADLPTLAAASDGVTSALGQGLVTGASAGEQLGADWATGAATGATAGTQLGVDSATGSATDVLITGAGYSADSPGNSAGSAGDVIWAQAQVPPGQGFLDRLQEMQQQQYPTQLPAPVQELVVPDTGPMPPSWFLALLAVAGLLWLLAMYASRVLVPERALLVTGTPADTSAATNTATPVEVIEAGSLPRDPALLFRLAYSAGTAAWLVVLVITTLLATESSAVQLWIIYLPLMALMVGAAVWAGLGTAEQVKLSRAERSLDRLEADLEAGVYGELSDTDPEDQAQLELLRHRAEQGRY